MNLLILQMTSPQKLYVQKNMEYNRSNNGFNENYINHCFSDKMDFVYTWYRVEGC